MGDILRLHRIIMPPADPPPPGAGPAERTRILGPLWLPLLALLASAAIAYLLLGGELPDLDLPLFGQSGSVDVSRLVKK